MPLPFAVGLPLLACLYWAVSLAVVFLRVRSQWFASLTQYGGRHAPWSSSKVREKEMVALCRMGGDKRLPRTNSMLDVRAIRGHVRVLLERSRMRRKSAFCFFYVTGIMVSLALLAVAWPMTGAALSPASLSEADARGLRTVARPGFGAPPRQQASWGFLSGSGGTPRPTAAVKGGAGIPDPASRTDFTAFTYNALLHVFRGLHFAPLALFGGHCLVRLLECFLVHEFRSESGKQRHAARPAATKRVGAEAELPTSVGTDTVTVFAAVAGMSFYVFAAISFCPLLLIEISSVPFAETAFFRVFQSWIGYNAAAMVPTAEGPSTGSMPGDAGTHAKSSGAQDHALPQVAQDMREVALAMKRVRYFGFDDEDAPAPPGTLGSYAEVLQLVQRHEMNHWWRLLHARPALTVEEAVHSASLSERMPYQAVLSNGFTRRFAGPGFRFFSCCVAVLSIFTLCIGYCTLQLCQSDHHEILAKLRRERRRVRELPPQRTVSLAKADDIGVRSPATSTKLRKRIVPGGGHQSGSAAGGDGGLGRQKVAGSGIATRTRAAEPTAVGNSSPPARVPEVYQYPAQRLFRYVLEPHYACEILMHLFATAIVGAVLMCHHLFFIYYPFTEPLLFSRSFRGWWPSIFAGSTLWPSGASLPRPLLTVKMAVTAICEHAVPPNGLLLVALTLGPPLGVTLFSLVNLGVTGCEHRRYWQSLDPATYTTTVYHSRRGRAQLLHGRESGATPPGSAAAVAQVAVADDDVEEVELSRPPLIPRWNLFYRVW